MAITLTLRSDKIIHVDATSIDVLGYKEFFEIADELRSFNKKYDTIFPCVITAKEDVLIEHEFKGLIKSKFFNKYTLASAVITNSDSQRLMVTIFARVAQLKSPIRSFKTKQKALIWLQQYAN